MSTSELVTLSAVHCEGLYLRLSDGRTMMINPDDAAGLDSWKADLKLSVREINVSAMFNLEVTQSDIGRTVRAAWV